MAINLGNVNISLRQFQEISSGKYNAGEVKLTSETGIGKVNNHVTMKFLNNTKISHMEVVATKNYAAARDQLVQFITGDDKATYKAASANVKKQTGLLMSIVTQYAPSMVKNAFVSTLSNGGHEMSLAGGRMKVQNPFLKPQTWTLGKAEDGSIKASVTITEGIGFLFTAQGQTQVDDTASYEETTLDITIPAGNLATLADQDWSTFDPAPFNAAGKDSDAQLKAIPQQFRLEATVNASYNLHFDAPAA